MDHEALAKEHLLPALVILATVDRIEIQINAHQRQLCFNKAIEFDVRRMSVR